MKILVLLGVLTMANAAEETRPLLAIPQLTMCTVDGDAGEWGDAGLRIGAFSEDGAAQVDPSLVTAAARLAWTTNGLAVLVDLRSTVPWVESASVRSGFDNDSVELFLRRGSAWRELVQLVIAPGMAPDQAEPRHFVWDYRGPLAEWKDAPLTMQVARRRVEGGCTIEALIPWAALRFAAMPKAECEFRININKRLPVIGRRQLVWRGAGGEDFHRLSLADHAAPAVDTAAWAVADAHGLAVSVLAPIATVGQRFSLRRGDNELASGLMQAGRDRAEGWLALPYVVADGTTLRILVGDRVVGVDSPKHPRESLRDRIRAAAFSNRRWIAEDPVRDRLVPRVPAVFRGPDLPQALSADPAMAVVAGIEAVTTTWFAADFSPVTKAERPGRYGAVISVRLEGGEKLELRQTCWVMAPGENRASGSSIAAALGLSASAAGDRDFSALLGTASLAGLRTRADAAALLAGLSEAPAGEKPMAEARDRAWWHGLRTTLGTQTRYEYFRLTPQGYDADPSIRWPAIIYLHGSGGRFPSDYTPFAKRNAHADLHGWAEGNPQPFVIYSLASYGAWEPPAVLDTVERILAADRIDPDRLIVMGFSMGGIGTWDCAVDYPERWAAAVPLGGRGYRVAEVERVKALPMWVFNGDQDNSTTLEDAQNVVGALQAVHGKVTFTVLPGADHGATQNGAFTTPGLWEWLAAQKRAQR